MQLVPCYFSLSDEFKRFVKIKDESISSSILYNTYISNWDFDEDWYLTNNKDILSGIEAGIFVDGRHHFRAVGYLEGRFPYKTEIDSSWYMSTYPDVAAAIIQEAFESAAHHFLAAGYREGRLPVAPDLDVGWYARTYLNQQLARTKSEQECLQHYVEIGYRNGALPHPDNRTKW